MEVEVMDPSTVSDGTTCKSTSGLSIQVTKNLCYVALDYEAELSKDTKASYEVAAAGWFTLAKERFQTGEILFTSHVLQECMRAIGLHQAVALCIDHCHDAELTADESWYKTVVLAGGTTCLPGVASINGREMEVEVGIDIRMEVEVMDPSTLSDGTTCKSTSGLSIQVTKNLCYVALDYEVELSKDTEASYEVAAAGWFTLAKERFQTREILFQPCRICVSFLMYFVFEVKMKMDELCSGIKMKTNFAYNQMRVIL
ncbi:putative Actin family, ATPase, nucleotide binding domain-containing protein [Helianthus annuus]|nr:putative Actin family, ATPase, nucleotide binding domain-containing protein [Helianthus annuus]